MQMVNWREYNCETENVEYEKDINHHRYRLVNKPGSDAAYQCTNTNCRNY